jgi:hypothetical protein
MIAAVLNAYCEGHELEDNQREDAAAFLLAAFNNGARTRRALAEAIDRDFRPRQ